MDGCGVSLAAGPTPPFRVNLWTVRLDAALSAVKPMLSAKSGSGVNWPRVEEEQPADSALGICSVAGSDAVCVGELLSAKAFFSVA
jgi:hypothetical protein